VFRPFGVESRPVVLHKTGDVIPEFVQLRIESEAPSFLALGDHPWVECSECGRRKYHVFTRGFLPEPEGELPGTHMIRTREFFGHGASAFRELLVSQELYQALLKHAVKGCSLLPTARLPLGSAPA
jgi:hypothetical protein